jgi:hypothetical protein
MNLFQANVTKAARSRRTASFHVTLVAVSCLILLASSPAWSAAVATSSLFGSGDAFDFRDQNTFIAQGIVACSAAGFVALASCSIQPTASDPGGSGASITLSLSLSTLASPNLIQFDGRVAYDFEGGATLPPTGSYQLEGGGMIVSDSSIISFGAFQPTLLRLTYVAEDEHPGTEPGGGLFERYSISVDNDPTWQFKTDQFAFGDQIFQETFLVNPAAGFAVVSLDGGSFGMMENQFGGTMQFADSLELENIEFLDANGDPLPEPTPITLCLAGLIAMGALQVLKAAERFGSNG